MFSHKSSPLVVCLKDVSKTALFYRAYLAKYQNNFYALNVMPMSLFNVFCHFNCSDQARGSLNIFYPSPTDLRDAGQPILTATFPFDLLDYNVPFHVEQFMGTAKVRDCPSLSEGKRKALAAAGQGFIE